MKNLIYNYSMYFKYITSMSQNPIVTARFLIQKADEFNAKFITLDDPSSYDKIIKKVCDMTKAKLEEAIWSVENLPNQEENMKNNLKNVVRNVNCGFSYYKVI